MDGLIRESRLTTPITSLPGIGAQKASLFARLGIFSLQDLIEFYPRAYKDTVRFYPFTQIAALNEAAAGVAETIAVEKTPTKNGMLTVITAIDEDGIVCRFPLFNRGFLAAAFPVGRKFYFYAKIRPENGRLTGQLIDFEKYSENPVFFKQYLPIYPLTAGLSSAFLIKTMRTALERCRPLLFFRLPKGLRPPFSLMPYADAVSAAHFPADEEEIHLARRTLAYLELYRFAAGAVEARLTRRKHSAVLPGDAALSPLQKKIIASLPFELTGGQKTALTEINRDLTSSQPMERLLQGDVGCGKTLVAFLAAARVMEKRQQCALMVPTDLLARQHTEKAFEIFEPLGKTVCCYTGRLSADAKRSALKPLKDGTIDLIIGTHALFGENVVFKNLGLVIIDEQHKFGVLQRASLSAKGTSPSVLTMSATPIPRTLAQTVYTALDVTTIEDLPKGRLPIETHLTRTGNEKKVYDFVLRELKAGRQAYFVYPVIEESRDSDLKDAVRMAETLQTQIFPDFRIALIHSRLEERQKEELMKRFAAREIDILVATTVVEVGIDNPNATVMVVENAQRFGLSTLHQLRGRIGRSNLQSYCFLIYDETRLTEEAKSRLKILLKTQNGFEIAAEDLRIRGPGEIFGERQAGNLKFKIADPLRDEKILLDITRQLEEICIQTDAADALF